MRLPPDLFWPGKARGRGGILPSVTRNPRPCCYEYRPATGRRKGSVIARNWAFLRGDVGPQVEEDFVDIAPAPALRRVIALDDGMLGVMEVLGGVFVLRLAAAADMAAGTADTKVQPHVARLQTFLAAQRAGRHFANGGKMRAAVPHQALFSSAALTRASARKACSAAT